MTEDEMAARIAIANRERNHLAQELEHALTQRDDAHEELSDLGGRYRFMCWCVVFVGFFAFMVGGAIGALHGLMT